jgi:two-component sensor histidine kinase
VAIVGADLESPAGYALQTGKSVISNHLENEERFRTPDILRQHGIHRAMNVILQGDGRPYGVLEVDSRSDDKFVEDDLAFLQGAANLLGMAIERERHERRLEAALDRHQALLREMNHRVKNSLTIVASMLRLQASDLEDAALIGHLDEASHRVAAVARAHDQLYQSSDVEQMDVGRYIEAICHDLDATISPCEIHVDAKHGIVIATDRAISAALIVNELIVNTAKYAYPKELGGKIWVTLAGIDDDLFSISVRDEGSGLPADFDLRTPKGLGVRIVDAFAKQLHGVVSIRRDGPGVEFTVAIPRRPPR